MSPSHPKHPPEVSAGQLLPRLVPLCTCMFLGFLTVSVPLPVLPLHVHRELGFGLAVAGLAIGIQSFATLATRAHAGRSVDRLGAKSTLLRGLFASSVAGLFYAASLPLAALPVASLALLLVGRLVLGYGESLLITGVLSWAVGRAGPSRTGTAMSWNGIAQYGALAAGAPIGLALYGRWGFASVAATTFTAPLVGAAIVWKLTPLPAAGGERRSLLSIVGSIWRPGVTLMLAGLGFASLTTFGSLAFAERAWSGAGLALTAFGAGFIGVRLVAGGLPDRLGGWSVAAVAFGVLAIGQGLLWQADRPATAIAAALVTGLGCSLMFPALGIEALRSTGPNSRGIALGAFAAFQDLAIGLTGPVLGLFAAFSGAFAPFLAGTIAAVAGLTLCLASSAVHPKPGVLHPPSS